MYVILVQFDIQPQHREAFMQALIKDGEGSLRDEPGTLRFEIIQDGSDPNRVFLHEGYADEAALQAHLQGPHFRTFRDTVKEWLARPLAQPPRGPFADFVVGRGLTIFPFDVGQLS